MEAIVNRCLDAIADSTRRGPGKLKRKPEDEIETRIRTSTQEAAGPEEAARAWEIQ